MNARAGMVFGAAEVNCTVQPIPPWSLGAPFRRARSTASTPPRCTARAFHALLVATACDISSTHRLPPRHSTALVRARRILLGSRSACMGRAVCGGCCVSDSGAHALSWNGASSFACAGRLAVGGVSPRLGVPLLVVLIADLVSCSATADPPIALLTTVRSLLKGAQLLLAALVVPLCAFHGGGVAVHRRRRWPGQWHLGNTELTWCRR